MAKITIFLGAGFSAVYGHPTMDEFINRARGSNRVSPEDRELLDALVKEARSSNGFRVTRASNLEEILSFAVMARRLGFDASDNREITLKKILQKIYSDPGKIEDYWSRYSKLENFLGFVLKKNVNDIAFITTNYDINIESACLSYGVPTNPSIEFSRANYINKHLNLGLNSGPNFYDPSGIKLYKLHGSVNWFLEKNSTKMTVDDYIVPVYHLGNLQDQPARTQASTKQFPLHQASLPSVCAADYYKNSPVPHIVPPSFLKAEINNHLQPVWQGAVNTLRDCEKLVFVGYSFPQSDNDMSYFLGTALRENVALRDIYVFDKNAASIVSRLRETRGPYGSIFIDLLRDGKTGSWINSTLKEQ